MGKFYAKSISFAVAAGVGIWGVGTLFQDTLIMPTLWWNSAWNPYESQYGYSAFASLSRETPAIRIAKLQKATREGSGLDQSRARYLLAQEWIRQNQGSKAIPLLSNLEVTYPTMAPAIAVLRARAFTQSEDPDPSSAAWREVITLHGASPLSTEAYYHLGKTNPDYWNQAVARFPAHPLSVEIARQQLRESPRSIRLLLQIARYGIYVSDIGSILDELVQLSATSPLSPTDWETIAFAYWEKQDYGKAGSAYARAIPTAQNLYRAGRGFQLDNQQQLSQSYYRRLIQGFPKDPLTGLALLRLARMSPPQTAMEYLDLIIQQFPERIGDALLEKIKLLEATGNTVLANKSKEALLGQQNRSDAAAEFRWRQTQQQAQSGNLPQAIAWAKPIHQDNPDSEFAAESLFWVGKWSGKLGRQQEAKEAYQLILRRYPESYYAWRSADLLGLRVGSFTTVRSLTPTINHLQHRPSLRAGSPLVRELYFLGQDRDAWALWQVEFTQVRSPSVAEQYTDGLVRLGIGDHLDGLFMISFLAKRESPSEQRQFQDLRKQLDYWFALYPFPFLEIIEQWAEKRQLNPLLVTALIRQESRFMPSIESVAGAKGLMQVMPDTGEWIANKINLKNYKLTNPDNNVELGTWYLDYTHREYNNHSLLAVASYNAGPAAVADWVQRFGLNDPDEFIEKIPFGETKGYVKTVFANYWNYLRLYNPDISKIMASNGK